MIAIFLFSFVSSRRSLSSVLVGTWTSTATYSSPFDDLLPFNISITQTGNSPNYLSSEFSGNPVQINLSFDDLSGNLTYLGEVYDFNFVERASPFISTDIDFRELGSAHCIILTFVLARCSIFTPEQSVSATLRKQAELSESNWGELRGAAIVIVIGVSAHWLLGEWMTKEQVKLESEVKEKRRKEAEEKAKGEIEADTTGKLKTE
jgi:hypothetical protein